MANKACLPSNGKLVLGLGLFSMLALSGLAVAADDNGFAVFDPSKFKGMKEIVVTAEKRETTLQKTPISLTALDEQALVERSISNVGDMADFVPNMSRTSGPTGGPEAYFFIRGVGQVDNNPALDPGVGVYVDEVYLGRTQGGALELLDIERIEVLRGPQGTLFGRNTIGGAVSVVSQDPEATSEMHGRLGAGERGLSSLYLAGSSRIAEDLGLSVAGLLKQQDGWATNIYTGETAGDQDTKGLRAKLVYDPEGAYEFALAADYSKDEGTPNPLKLRSFNTAINGGKSALNVPFLSDIGAERNNNREQTFTSTPAINDIEAGGASATFRWTVGELTVKSITAYRMVEQLAFNDFDGGGYSFYDSMTMLDQEQISQEFQLAGLSMDDKLDWLLGAYYFDEDIDHFTKICLGTNDGSDGGMVAAKNPSDGRCLSNNQALDISIQSWALFAHANYKIDDRYSLVLGGRYTAEDKEQAYDITLDNTDGVFGMPQFPGKGNSVNTLGPNSPIPDPFAFNNDWSEFTPKVGLNFQKSDNTLWYTSYSTGFKSGGFSGRPVRIGAGDPIESYNPEETQTLEVGVKGQYYGNRLRVNAAVFHSEYDDIQLLVINPMNGSVDTINAGDAEIDGAEFELAVRPIPALNVALGVGYLDNEYSRVDPTADGVEKSDKLPLTPEWTVNLGAQYDFLLGEAGSLAIRADLNYQSEVSFQLANNVGDLQGSYSVLNLRTTYTPNNTWNVAAYVKNALDKEYNVNALDSRSGLGPSFYQPGKPREFGMEVGFQF